MSQREWELYMFAFSCTLSALVKNAETRGRGWYHYSDGTVIIAQEITL